METLLLLVASLFVSPDANYTTTTDSSYTQSYDAATGSTIVSNPDGSIIVVDPDENN